MLLIATIHTKAQQIKGRVVEILSTGEESPLPGANVVWDGTNIGTTSNEQGFYIIAYAGSISFLNLFIGFLSPAVDPDIELDIELGGSDSDEFKPFGIKQGCTIRFFY